MQLVISVESLGKEYVIGAAAGHGTLREALMRIARSPARIFAHAEETTVWALRDVSFKAAPGDVIGVVGKNGAGKSTLLKILSRITEPTTGRAELYGRVGSLLEVGTGFHQDLTGRENVFLNGAILGMKRAEITRKFDDIVGFAEVERFIDTPVKHYSSGMYLRLAFAVAAFLESEILLVDEVLAVGDVSFQKRCLGKMREVSASGRTVLFVSHNMAAIEALCNRCVYISKGMLIGDGPPHDVLAQYLSAESAPSAAAIALESHTGRRAGSEVMMRRAALSGDHGLSGAAIRMGTDLTVSVEYHSNQRKICPVLGVTVKNQYGMPVFGMNNRLVPGYEFATAAGAGMISCTFKRVPLMPGTYSLDLYLGDSYRDYDAIFDAVSFDVIEADVFGSGKLPGGDCGSVFQPATWAYSPGENTLPLPALPTDKV
ncbi:MAG TPA: ABC transporter ATP-binding protein [Vicinamibacterales bacterium]|nr:ABC transporter ATP-binding protein [Vicinamibacterales bacterium]